MDYGTSIESYLGWRGDIPFSVSPFSEIDAIVLCKLACYGLVALDEAKTEAGLSLAECTEEASGLIAPKGLNSEGRGFFEKTAATKRFGDVRVCRYVDTEPSLERTQFSAEEFRLPDGRIFVAFRGTDSTILGWKEDFELSFKETEAQKRARSYLAEALRHAEGSGTHLLVGGHSKGANLAQYATAGLTGKELSRIDAIYLLDGPGMAPELASGKPSRAWIAKTIRIIPSFSVFGRLFEPALAPFVVHGSGGGVFQHELLSWQLREGKFGLAAKPDPESDYCAEVFHEWMDNVSLEERQEFTDDLFSAIARTGSTTSEISATLAESLPKILAGVASSRPGAKKAAAKLPLRLMAGKVLDALPESFDIRWLLGNGLAHCLELAAGGVLLIALHKIAIPLALSLALFAVVAVLFTEMLIRLKASGWDAKKEQPRMAAFLVAALVFVLAIVKPEALYIYASLFFGIILSLGSWSYAKKARSGKERGTSPIFNGFCAIALALSAVFVLVAPYSTFAAYATSLGYLLFICAIAAFLDWRHEASAASGL
jgi:hypothetical protein